ncbi:MAG: membrane protein insertase YidC [Myxococcales bacterium]|nr:membrane protein insertase YidC [Myxococcales bacterium]MBP6842515.1 membrane protein insertase YidC [Kofleriaceae bacterium]
MEDQGKRIVLFVVIAGAIFLGWQFLFPPEKPAKKAPVTATDAPAVQSPTWGAGSGAPTPAPGTGSAPAAGSGAPAAPPAVQPAEALAPEETLQLATPRMQLTFSNIGGTIKRVHRLDDPMKGGRVNDDLFISNQPGVGFAATSFVNSTYPLSPLAAWKGEAVSPTKVRYTYERDGLSLAKEYEVLADDWMVKVTLDIKVAAAASQRLAVSMFAMAPQVEGQRKWPKIPWTKCDIGGSIYGVNPHSANGPQTRSGRVRFFGAATPYFMFALAPRPDGSSTYDCNVYPLPAVKDAAQVDLVYAETKIPAGETIRKELYGYFGPGYLDKFEHADEVAGFKMGLGDTVDFGWFSFISKPLLWLLRHIFALVGNWGIAIILLTVMVKLATLYWTNKSMKSMKAMAALKPEMEALQKKFGDDRQKMQQAQMELFKRHGVNPLAGCLPMLLQMPIWMGLYRMLSHAGELHQAVFIPGWLDDLTLQDPYYILPVSLMGLMFLQSKLQPTTGDNAQQKMLTYGLPLMFGVMGLWFPAGLTVYITTNTVLGLLHTLYMKRSSPPPVKPAAPAAKDETEELPAAKALAKGDKAAKVEAADEGDAAEGDADEGDADEGDADEGPAKGAQDKAPRAGQGRRGKRRNKRR